MNSTPAPAGELLELLRRIDARTELIAAILDELAGTFGARLPVSVRAKLAMLRKVKTND